MSALSAVPDFDAVLRPLRVEAGRPPIDLVAAELAVSNLLKALGQDTFSPHLLETPRRVAASFAEMLEPRPFDLTTFENDGSYDGLVVARDLPVRSMCQHHMLPFVGTAHVAYLPGERIVGLSKLGRIVEHFAKDFQVQERLTAQVATWIERNLAPKGVAVVVEAEHFCMSLRGVQAHGSKTITSTFKGILRTDDRARDDFFRLAGVGR